MNEENRLKTIIAEGVLHEVPDDMKKVLKTNAAILERWKKLTPVQRNEWICLVILLKARKQELNILAE